MREPPAVDVDSQPFWLALREHRVELQRCTGCGRLRFPPMPSCPWCASASWVTEEHPGAGTVYSYIVVHRALDPAFADDVPYSVGVVELDEGPRIVARLEVASPCIGQRLAASFVDHAGWTELRFEEA